MAAKEYWVQVILENDSGSEIAKETVVVTIDTPGTYKFENLSAGTYTQIIIPPENVALISENPQKITLENNDSISGEIYFNDIKILSPSPSLPPGPRLPGCIAIPSISIAIMAMMEPSCTANLSANYKPNTQRRNQTVRTQPNPSNVSALNSRNISFSGAELSERLRQCLTKNLKSLADFPSLSGVMLSAIEDSSDDEFLTRAIYLYKTSKQMRSFLEKCDATLIDEFLAVEESVFEQKLLTNKVMVLGNYVNIRTSDTLESMVLEQVHDGDILELDTTVFNSLANPKLTAIERDKGWFPIILPDGRKGYIHSLYADRLQ